MMRENQESCMYTAQGGLACKQSQAESFVDPPFDECGQKMQMCTKDCQVKYNSNKQNYDSCTRECNTMQFYCQHPCGSSNATGDPMQFNCSNGPENNKAKSRKNACLPAYKKCMKPLMGSTTVSEQPPHGVVDCVDTMVKCVYPCGSEKHTIFEWPYYYVKPGNPGTCGKYKDTTFGLM